MKSLMTLWHEVALNLGDLCNVSTTADFNTVRSRVEGEGLSFLTITLPAFCDDLQKGLADERITHSLFTGFTWRGGLPLFLGGFLELIFDRSSGCLLADPSIDAIHAVRQLTLMYGKVELPTTDRRVRRALRGFVECESEVKRHDISRSETSLLEFRNMSRQLWGGVLSRVETDLSTELLYSELRSVGISHPDWPFVIPKHGPGATADRLSGNGKFDLRYWPQRLEAVFPFGEYALPNERHDNRLDRVDFREPGTELPVKVITVPKTMKTPRIIAVEPTCMQYMQQGLKRMIVDHIHSDKTMGVVVGFDDQWRNNRLAMEGSLTGSLATLDLSEASDRVSNQLVRAMLAEYPLLFEGVDATRSRRADVPGYGVIRLAKFASMGSALTFPLEAMIFTTVVFLGIQKSLDRRLSPALIQGLRKKVRVFGDDIIVPNDYALDVIGMLETFGFKVSHTKSFWTGKFRESCGKEYYAGHDVSVVRVRKLVDLGGRAELPSSRQWIHETESTVALRNKFYLAGLWRAAAWLDEWNRSLLEGWYPTIVVGDPDSWKDPFPRSTLLGRWSVLRPRLDLTVGKRAYRPNHDTQTLEVKGWVTHYPIPASPASEVGALQKVLAPGRLEPFQDVAHLEFAGRPKSSYMKLGWRHYV